MAVDGAVGKVETPLFPPDGNDPDYVILQVRRGARLRRPVVPVALVEGVDPERGLVALRATVEEVAHMPEYLPLAGRRPQ